MVDQPYVYIRIKTGVQNFKRETLMLSKETIIKYYIFKCLNIACKEIFPVQFFSSQMNSSSGISLMVLYAEGLNENMVSVDAKCPFCRRINHFQINESIKEISEREFEMSINIVNAKISLMNVITGDPQLIRRNFTDQESL
jgi:hypothetical protein